MADVVEHRDILDNFPVIAQSIVLAACAPLRNMATHVAHASRSAPYLAIHLEIDPEVFAYST